MKIVTVTLGSGPDDRPEAEGWVILNYSAQEGGRTNIGAPIRANAETGLRPTWGDLAALLGSYMGGRPWPSFVKANVAGNQVRMAVPDEVDSIVFYAEWQPSLDQIGPVQLNPPFVVIAEEKFGV